MQHHYGNQASGEDIERGANHSSGSLKQEVWGAAEAIGFYFYEVATEMPPNARFRVFNSNLKVL